MGEFKVIFRADGTTCGNDALTYEQGCPGFVEAVQISRNTKTGAAYLQLKVRNIGNEGISGLSLLAHVEFADGSVQEEKLSCLDADIAPGDAFRVPAVELKQPEALRAHARITELRTTTYGWKSKADARPLPNSEPVVLSENAITQRERELARAKRRVPAEMAGHIDAALLCISEEHDAWWRCACGAPNMRTQHCWQCGLEHDALKRWEDEAYLEQAFDDEERQRARAAEEAESRKQRNKKIGIATAAAAAVIVAILLVVTQVVMPSMKYSDARSKLDAGNYAEAAQMFEDLGEYNDAAAKAKVATAKQQVADGELVFAMDTVEPVASEDEEAKAVYEECDAQLPKDLADAPGILKLTDNDRKQWLARNINGGEGAQSMLYEWENHSDADSSFILHKSEITHGGTIWTDKYSPYFNYKFNITKDQAEHAASTTKGILKHIGFEKPFVTAKCTSTSNHYYKGKKDRSVHCYQFAKCSIGNEKGICGIKLDAEQSKKKGSSEWKGESSSFGFENVAEVRFTTLANVRFPTLAAFDWPSGVDSYKKFAKLIKNSNGDYSELEEIFEAFE